MRYATRDSLQSQPQSLHVSIDALLEEARQIERAKILLEVRRELGAVPVTQPKAGSSWDREPRRGGDVARDMIAIIDRKLA